MLFIEWLLLAGQHGEFELIFTIPPESAVRLGTRAGQHHQVPVPIGVVTERPGVLLPLDGETVELDTARIRNLPSEVGNNIEDYIGRLMSIGREKREGAR